MVLLESHLGLSLPANSALVAVLNLYDFPIEFR